MMQRRRPGKVVQCQDGRIGRTYNDEPFIDGKVRVYLFPDSVRLAMEADKATARQKDATITKAKQEITRTENRNKEPEKRLCDPTTLKVVGMAD